MRIAKGGKVMMTAKQFQAAKDLKAGSLYTLVHTAMELSGNVVSDAARICGVSRPTFYAWLKQTGLVPARRLLSRSKRKGAAK